MLVKFQSVAGSQVALWGNGAQANLYAGEASSTLPSGSNGTEFFAVTRTAGAHVLTLRTAGSHTFSGRLLAVAAPAALTLGAAVKASTVSLSTMRRHLNDGRIPGAVRTDAGWSIPISGLIAAGYALRISPADGMAAKPAPSPAAEVDGLDVLRDENARLRRTVERLEAANDAQREHLADLRRMLDMFAQALPVATTSPAEVTETASPTAMGSEPPRAPRRRWWKRR